ncbi:MAG: DegT/DnrJ/EryC1/StrS family aminotransferase, partial [Thermoguttaceae bacterium]
MIFFLKAKQPPNNNRRITTADLRRRLAKRAARQTRGSPNMATKKVILTHCIRMSNLAIVFFAAFCERRQNNTSFPFFFISVRQKGSINMKGNFNHISVESTIQGVALLDLKRQYAVIKDEIHDALRSVCDSGAFVLGPEVKKFEESIAHYTQVPHAIACASGSDAILLGLMAANIGPGDEVLVPSFTFFATASAVTRLGARPVFVDIDPGSYNIDVQDVIRKITPRTKAIVPVHLFGQMADMLALNGLAQKHGMTVIEDAAQAIGAELNGRRAGSWGDIGAFSFYPTKNLGGAGDGGLVTTQNDQLAKRLNLLHVHGMEPRYYHSIIGINSRLDS